MEFVYNRTYRGALKAAILDWAGTTCDFGCCAPAVVFVKAFKDFGVDITAAEAREPMGMHKRTHILRITEMAGVRERWHEAHGRFPTEDDVDQMFAKFEPMQIDVVAEHADLVPGCLEAIAAFREKGLKIGSSTGYTEKIMDVLVPEAKKKGYDPDSMVCGGAVPAGRPEPWMAYRNMENLRVFPAEAVVKIGDTVPDILEGLNAGMWSVGVAMTGNEVGLNEAEFNAAAPGDLERKRAYAYDRLQKAGAHYVVDSIADVPPLIDEINARLARGERP